jgi:hypothetical protein
MQMLTVNHILSEVKQLDKEDQLNLLERLVLLIRKKENIAKDVKLSSISGIGSEIWSNMDIDKYIESEREW